MTSWDYSVFLGKCQDYTSEGKVDPRVGLDGGHKKNGFTTTANGTPILRSFGL
jgi:hypothetical protein